MTTADLEEAFSAVAFKTLSSVETNPKKSHQHEFNGSRALQELFGSNGPQRIPTDFVWMPDDGDFVQEPGLLTWYDARAKHPTRTEYRLYYVGNGVTGRASAGDFLLIARRSNGSTLVLLAPGSGIAAARIALIFGIEVRPGSAFAAISLDVEDRRRIATTLGFEAISVDSWAADGEVAASWTDPAIKVALSSLQRDIGRDYEARRTDEWTAEDNH